MSEDVIQKVCRQIAYMLGGAAEFYKQAADASTRTERDRRVQQAGSVLADFDKKLQELLNAIMEEAKVRLQ